MRPVPSTPAVSGLRASALAAALALGLLCPGAGQAAFSYQEAVSGDLLPLPPPGGFVFTAGVNTVSGHSGWLPADISADEDPFGFTIPAGLRLVGVQYAFGNLALAEGNTSLMTAFVLRDTLAGLAIAFVSIMDASPVATFAAALPVGPGDYLLDNPRFDRSPSLGGSWDYTWSFTVADITAAAIPEPATLALLGPLAAGLGLRGRAQARRRQRT